MLCGIGVGAVISALWICIVAGFVLLVASSSGAVLAQDKASPSASGLKQLGEQLQRAVASNDVKRAAQITRSLLCDRAQITKALSSQVSPDMINKIAEMHNGAPKDEQQLANMLRIKPGQSVVTVFSATTEELAGNAPGSVAHDKFPGGAIKLASSAILRPGMTFYKMTFVEPGKEAGMSHDLFYWDGQNWKMLGSAWRVLEK